MHRVHTGMIVVATIAFAASAWADTVYMKSGDRATGELIQFDGDELELDSDFADEIKIDLEDIESIETTRPVRIEFDDGTEVTGYIVRDQEGQMRIQESPPPGDGEEAPAPAVEPYGRVLDLSTVHLMEEAKTYYNYQASLNLGLNAATGNTDQQNLNVSWDLQPSFGENHLTLKGQLNRAESDGDTTASNWRQENTYERDLTLKWRLAGLLNFDHDKLQDLNLRTTAGVGPSYEIFKPSPTLLKVGLAPAFVDENRKDENRQFAALLWLLRFEQDLYTDDLEFYHNHRLIAALSESGVIVQTTTGLKFDLIDDFDLLLEVQFDWNSEPADDAEESDQRYLVKIGYTFEGNENDWWH